MHSVREKDFADMMLDCLSIWTWQYDNDFLLIASNCPDERTVGSAFVDQKDLVHELRGRALLPAVITSADGLAWAVIVSNTNDTDYHVLGPIRADDEIDTDTIIPDYTLSLLKLSLDELSRYASMFHRSINGRVVPIRIQIHGSSMTEDAPAALLLSRLQDAIRNGDTNFRELMTEVLTNRHSLVSLGAVTTASAKHLALLAIDLCAQAAVESGLPENTVHALTEEYVPKIEATNIPHEIVHWSNLLMYHFVRMVRSIKGVTTLSPTIQTCCTYMEEHASEKITVSFLAKLAGYSPDHLSRRFRSEVGESIKSYLTRLKVHRAQILLTTTSMPLVNIATALSFCSASHFTKVFGQFTGVTPAVYRSKHSHL